MKKKLLCLLLLVSVGVLNAQTLLVIVNADAKIFLDGDEKTKTHANDATKIEATKGQHYLQAKGKWNGRDCEVHQTIDVESDGQTIINLNFKNEQAQEDGNTNPNSTSVADLTMKLPGTISVNEWKSNNPGKNYPDYPTYYYAFEKGDDIVLNFKNPGSKTTNKILVYAYPGKETKYSNNSFTELNDIHIKVDERCIYIFEVTTNHALSSSGELLINRIAGSEATKSFNTSVSKHKVYKPEYIQTMQEFTIHSSGHLTGGNKEIVPVILPPHTVKWYYKFTASRSKAQTAQVQDGLKLFEEIAGACGAQGKMLATGISFLSMPPGSDNCDVYLLDEQNHLEFNANRRFSYLEEGSRTGLMSGNMEIKQAIGQNFYIGISNPSSLYAINVSIEVVAITQKEELVIDGN